MYKERDLNTLVKLEDNPRFIREDQFDTLCDSLKDNPDYFKARPLILSNRTGELVIIAGNQRYEAAKHIGLSKVPTFLIEGLTEEREKEIIIRDNVSNGEWDHDLLANNWDSAQLFEWGVPITDIKLSDDEDEEPEEDKPIRYLLEVDCKTESERQEVEDLLLERGYKVKKKGGE